MNSMGSTVAAWPAPVSWRPANPQVLVHRPRRSPNTDTSPIASASGRALVVLRARVGGVGETDDGDSRQDKKSQPQQGPQATAAMASPSPPAPAPQSDRAALLKAFDEARTGVRGLVESGVSSVPAASWRDTVQIAFGPSRPDLARIPAVCRDEVVEWDAHATAVGRLVLGLLSEGLGLAPTRLEEASCLEGKVMVCHYYPVCPEPERTMGLVPHTDPGVLTVLAQDGVGGLQVKQIDDDGGSHWVDVKPVPGALVINVGDLLQIMSNDKYKSVDHRVIMNTREEARVSIAIFFNPGKRGDSDFYGPLPELVSSDSPPKYRNFTLPEFLGGFFRRDLASRALADHFKL